MSVGVRGSRFRVGIDTKLRAEAVFVSVVVVLVDGCVGNIVVGGSDQARNKDFATSEDATVEAEAAAFARRNSVGIGLSPQPPPSQATQTVTPTKWGGMTPGVQLGCWGNGFTYERCCGHIDDSCWTPVSGFNRASCCSAFMEVMLVGRGVDQSNARLDSRTELMPSAPAQLRDCIEETEEQKTPWQRKMKTREADLRAGDVGDDAISMLQMAECVARLEGVDVVLDLLVGGGFTTARLAYGLGPGHGTPGQDRGNISWKRPPLLIGFERKQSLYQDSEALLLGLGARRGLWTLNFLPVHEHDSFVKLHSTFGGSEQPYESLGKFTDRGARTGGVSGRRVACPTLSAGSACNVSSPRLSPLDVWVLLGEPIFRDKDRKYLQLDDTKSWAPLDMLCLYKGPFDMVLIDTDTAPGFEREWLTIEMVCRPRWVLLNNLNIEVAASWIFHRLELLGNWQLQARGHFVMSRTPWPSFAEVRRVRTWALFKRIDD
eukprot:TRINITY_DN58108_c0_g1_i1.p1 TRINITY_DN58108_c0_g1~~TRINITY_DN58108_c0_g1_i1.p1  ORF type:complete len:489 (+),score=66.77 TRINITY_DN58108_c0_g1_i1:138-1604(+)